MSSLFLDDALTDARVGSTVGLSGAEARHAATVNRLRPGETISIGNGRGLVCTGRVTTASAASVEITVDGVDRVPAAAPRIVLVQALAKGGRDEMAVQAATELGVDVVVPWAARRSIARWAGEKQRRGVARWRAIVREATKQSLRSWLPEVGEVCSTAELCEKASEARMLVLEPTAAVPLAEVVGGERPDDRDLVVVIGPEGGVAPDELGALIDAGAQDVRLGPTVLRTSTAGPAAIAAISALGPRW